MTLEEFEKKYTGEAIDFDGFYGTQCMDLMHQYVYDVLGLKDATILAAQFAKLVYEKFRWGKYFDRIDNTPHAIPEKGDIVFWGGRWGHVAIFLRGDVDDFTSFDVNYPIDTLPHEQYHNYDNVLGWLRVKDNSADDHSILQKAIDTLEADLRASKKIEIKLKAKIDKMGREKEKFEKKYVKEVKELAEQRDKCQLTLTTTTNAHKELVSRLKNRILDLQKPEEVNDMNKKVLLESIKEPVRLLVLAIIPFAVAYFAELPFSWAGMATVILRGLDSYLHTVGKATKNKRLITGLTRF